MAFITLDFETVFSSGKHAESFSLSKMTYEEYIGDPRFWVYGVGIKIDQEPAVWYDFTQYDITETLDNLFPAGNQHTMLCHNTMFDAAVLCWYYGLRAKQYMCSMQMSKGLWRYDRAGLGPVAERLFPNDSSMRKGKELALADGLFTPEEYTKEILDYIGGYCIQDCELTFAAFAAMYPHYPADELEVIDDVIKMFAHRPLVLDHQLVVDYQKELIEEKEAVIEASGLPRSVLNSSQKFAERVEKDFGIVIEKVKSPTIKNPKNMKYPLAKDDLSFMKLRNERPDLDHIWKARLAAASNQEITRCTRFLNHGCVSPTNKGGHIAIPLNYCGAGTTRFSGTNSINMQNLGRNSTLRNALRAPVGHKLIISDLSNIEGRMAAYHAMDWTKLAKYTAGVDLYNELATDVFGYNVDRKLKDEKGKKIYAAEGALGKTAELGLQYGMGVNKFIETCHKGPMGEAPMLWVDEELGQRTVSTWRSQNQAIVNSWKIADNLLEVMADPGTKPFTWNTIEIHFQGFRLPSGLFVQYPRLKYDRSVFKNEDGSDRWTWMFWNGKFWKDLWGGTVVENLVQGISRVVMTDAEVRIKRRAADLGVQIVLQVHDELIFVCPEQHVEEASQIVREELTRTPTWADDRLVLDCSMDISDFYMKG